jgi:glycerophosphoryl diester phosphodiesterase
MIPSPRVPSEMAEPTHPYLDWPGPLAFAHRGGASEHPENTMPAFQHAVDLGYRYLETDVHATSDGVLVAFHDPDLSRTCGIDARISDLPWSVVSEARVDGREPIPLLDELMSTYPAHRFNIDCKSDEALPGLISAIRRLDCLDRICVGSFSDRRLRALRSEFGDRLCTSIGPAQIAALRVVGRMPWGGRIAQVPVRRHGIEVTTAKLVERAHGRGMEVHVWVVDDPHEMRRLLDLGADGLMTDCPQILKDVLAERGEWTDFP